MYSPIPTKIWIFKSKFSRCLVKAVTININVSKVQLRSRRDSVSTAKGMKLILWSIIIRSLIRSRILETQLNWILLFLHVIRSKQLQTKTILTARSVKLIPNSSFKTRMRPMGRNRLTKVKGVDLFWKNHWWTVGIRMKVRMRMRIKYEDLFCYLL